MQTNVQQVVIVAITLKLDREEAAWLHDVMQNPLSEHGEVENAYDAEMRKKFFDATTIPKL